MIHAFDVGIAQKLGVHAAILLQHIGYWVAQNKANGTNEHDGDYWTYNSKAAFAEQFPYMTERQIGYALQKLIDGGLIKTGNYNKIPYDRTMWYALTENGKSILQICQMGNTNLSNETDKNVGAIPYINTDTNTSSKPDKGKPIKQKHGEFANVLLTEDELQKLKSEYSDYQAYIERLSAYIAQSGKKYKSHYATILNWIRRDEQDGKRKPDAWKNVYGNIGEFV